MAISARRGSPTITARQRAMFLEAFIKTLNTSTAADIAGFDRSCIYDWRSKGMHTEFLAEYDLLNEQRWDVLEDTAFDLATKGDFTFISNKDGEITMDPEKPKEPLKQYKRDGRVLTFLLTNRRASRWQNSQTVNVAEVPAELLPDPVPTPDEAGPENPIV